MLSGFPFRRGAFALAVSLSAVASALGAGPLPAAADTQPRIITDVRVVAGDSTSVACPDGFARKGGDLNRGSQGKYVYACVQYGTDPLRAIAELYVVPAFDRPAQCDGEDTVVSGDMNEGVYNGGVSGAHEALYFCIHRSGHTGGSARIADPGSGRNDYFAVPGGAALTDLGFVEFSPDNLPACNNTACVDVGIGALSYLEYGVTIDPYCQQKFGADWHPIYHDWEYHPATGDRSAAVPQDSAVMNLNAGTLGAPLIYACGQYRSLSPILMTATTPDGQPYQAGTWTDQTIAISFICLVPTPQILAGSTVAADGADQMVTSQGDCRDSNGNLAAPVTYGPIDVDKTPPSVQYTNNAGTYGIDQPVSIGCIAADDPGQGANRASGLASTTCQEISAWAYTLGPGTHSASATATDRAGNVGQGSTTFSILVTPKALNNLAQRFLANYPAYAQAAQVYLNRAGDPQQRDSAVAAFQSTFSTLASAGTFDPETAQHVQMLIQLSRALVTHTVNDTDAGFHYTGWGWGYYTQRGVGDLQDDVHATVNDGDSVDYTFVGSGVQYITEKSVDEGKVEVFIDGALRQTVNAAADVHNLAGQVVFQANNLSAGQHTIRLVKRGGPYMLIDALKVVP